MELPVIIVVIILGAAIFLFLHQRKRPLSDAAIEDVKRRISTLQERTKTQFAAAPGDPRLKPDWEYMVALQKPSEDTFTFTFFTHEGISHTQSGMKADAIDAMTKEGWYINSQTFRSEGMSWQLERPIAKQ